MSPVQLLPNSLLPQLFEMLRVCVLGGGEEQDSINKPGSVSEADLSLLGLERNFQ